MPGKSRQGRRPPQQTPPPGSSPITPPGGSARRIPPAPPVGQNKFRLKNYPPKFWTPSKPGPTAAGPVFTTPEATTYYTPAQRGPTSPVFTTPEAKTYYTPGTRQIPPARLPAPGSVNQGVMRASGVDIGSVLSAIANAFKPQTPQVSDLERRERMARGAEAAAAATPGQVAQGVLNVVTPLAAIPRFVGSELGQEIIGNIGQAVASVPEKAAESFRQTAENVQAAREGEGPKTILPGGQNVTAESQFSTTVQPLMEKTLEQATGGIVTGITPGTEQTGYTPRPEISAEAKAMGAGALDVGGLTLAPLGTLQNQTTGRLYGAFREAVDIQNKAVQDSLAAQGLTPQEIDAINRARLIGEPAKALVSPKLQQAWKVADEAAIKAMQGVTENELVLGGDEYFENKLPIGEQIVASFLIPDPLDAVAAIAFGGKAARWASKAGDVAEFALLPSSKSMDEVAGLLKTGEIWGGNPVVRKLESLIGEGPNPFRRTPESSAALLADNSLTFVRKITEGKSAGAQAEILEGLVKYSDGDAGWLKVAEKYGFNPRTIDADEAARLSRLGERAGAIDFSKNKLVEGGTISPIESLSGQSTALLLREIRATPSNSAELLQNAAKALDPLATPAQKLAARQAEKQLLARFLDAADRTVGVSAEKNLGQKVYSAWRGWQGALAQVQLASPGRVVRDALTSITDGIADGTLAVVKPRFWEKWGSLPSGTRSGVGAGMESSREWFAAARRGLEEKAILQGGVKGKITQATADVLGGVPRWAAMKEDFFAEMPVAKGIQFVWDNAWRGKQVVPRNVLNNITLSSSADLADDFASAISNAYTPADIDEAVQAALGGELYRFVPDATIPKLRDAGLLEPVQDLAKAADSEADFIRGMNDLALQKRIDLQKAVTGALLPPDPDFAQAALAAGKKYNLSQDYVQAMITQREASRAAKVTAMGMAKDTLFELKENKPQEFQKLWQEFNDTRINFDARQAKTLAAEQMVAMGAAKENAAEEAARMGLGGKQARQFVTAEIASTWQSFSPRWGSLADDEIAAWHGFRNKVEELLGEPMVDDATAKAATDALKTEGEKAVAEAQNALTPASSRLSAIEGKIQRAETIQANATPDEAGRMRLLSQIEEVAPQDISKIPRDRLPDTLSSEIEYTAKRMNEELSMGEAPWFQEFGEQFGYTKKQVQAALDKVIADAGADVDKRGGQIIKRIKQYIKDEMMKPDPLTGEPPNARVIEMLQAQTGPMAQAGRAEELRRLEDEILARAEKGRAEETPVPEEIAKQNAPTPAVINPSTAIAARIPYEVKLLTDVRKQMVKGWGKTYGAVSPTAAAHIQDAAKVAKERIAETRLVAERFGRTLRDSVYFNYSDRRNMDALFGAFYAYPYWYTREMAAWSRRLFENPHFTWAMWNAHDEVQEQNADMPEWMRQNANVSLGDGGLLSFNLFGNLDPMYSLWAPEFNESTIAKDPAGKMYLGLQNYGPGSLHGGIPMALGLLASATGQKDLAYSYAGYVGSPTRLAAGLSGFLPEGPLRNRPPIPEAYMPGQYTQMVADTPDGPLFVGAKYDKKRIAIALSEMAQAGQISTEMAQQVLFIADAPFDSKRYKDNPDYQEAYRIFTEAVMQQRRNMIWQPVSGDAFQGLDPESPLDAALIGIMNFSAQKFGGIPGPVLLSFLGGPAGRYRTSSEVDVMNAQQEYAKVREQRESLMAQGDQGAEKYRELVRDFWQKHSDPSDPYALYVMGGKTGTAMDETYTWSVLSRIGKGRLDNPFLEAAGVDRELLQNFYDSGGIPEEWTKTGSYDYDRFMESIRTLGAVMAAPDLATADEWDEASAERKSLYLEWEKQYDESELEAFETYKYGGIEDKAAREEFMAAHPFISGMLTSEAEAVLGNPLVASYYASDGMIRARLYGDFYAENADGKHVSDVYHDLLEMAKTDDTAKELARQYKAENKEVIDAYNDSYKVFKAGLDDETAKIRDSFPDVMLPEVRSDLPAGGEFVGRLTEAQKGQQAAEEGAYGEFAASAEVSPTSEAARLLKQRQAEIDADIEAKNARQGYITTVNKDEWSNNWLGPLVAAYGQGAKDYYREPISDKWLPMTSGGSGLDYFVGDSGSIREAIMQDGGKTWTRVVAYLMSLSLEEIEALRMSDPRFADAALVAEQARRYSKPSLAAMMDIIGISASVAEDGSVFISRKSNLSSGGAYSGGGGGAGRPRVSTPEDFDWNKYYGGEGPPRPGARRSAGNVRGVWMTTPDGTTVFRPEARRRRGSEEEEGAAAPASGTWQNFAQAFGANPETASLLTLMMNYFDLSSFDRQEYLGRYPELKALLERLGGQLADLEASYSEWRAAQGGTGFEGVSRRGTGQPTIQRFYPRRPDRSGL